LGDSQYGYVTVANARWRNVNLAVVTWPTQLKPPKVVLGDERAAYVAQATPPAARTDAYRAAVRANRQLALALQSQGLNENAAHFAYRAQLLQREVLWQEGNLAAYLFSLFIGAVSGYGYRLWRIFFAYGVVLAAFALIFWALGVHSFAAASAEPWYRSLWDSLLVSLSAIHGRTISEQLGAWTPVAWVAALESVIGIVIEGVFVAMIIQRLFR